MNPHAPALRLSGCTPRWPEPTGHGWRSRGAAALVTAFLVAGCTAVDRSAPPSAQGGAARVEFSAPERFTDIGLTRMSDAESRVELMRRLTLSIPELAAKRLPAGQRLEMRITDIDLEGEIRPTPQGRLRSVQANDYVRLRFDYRLLDANGTVIAAGPESLSRSLTEPDLRASSASSTALLESLLDGWLRRFAKA